MFRAAVIVGKEVLGGSNQSFDILEELTMGYLPVKISENQSFPLCQRGPSGNTIPSSKIWGVR